MSGLTLAQTESRPVNLGTIPEFTNQFLSAAKTDGGAIHMALAGNKFIDVKVIDNQTTEQEVRIYGEVQNAKTSIFYFYGDSRQIKGKVVVDNKEGYEITTNDANQVQITQVDVNKLICVSPGTTTPPGESGTRGNTTRDCPACIQQ
ncbi:MAG: hypothetical protein H6585_06510 [Flavobacteriales bacterium]|nr:hypothetical protein [Flavobacteriales bacterium]MCB9447981.1 hypothetical protein [Flavobacteriales bacterium]